MSIHISTGQGDIEVKVGRTFTGDTFYYDDPDWSKLWAEYGVLVVEMETNALYTLAAKYNIAALSILTVSDHLGTEEKAPAADRGKAYTQMAKIALEISPG